MMSEFLGWLFGRPREAPPDLSGEVDEALTRVRDRARAVEAEAEQLLRHPDPLRELVHRRRQRETIKMLERDVTGGGS